MPNWPKLVSRVRVSNLFGWREDGCAAGDPSFQHDDVQLRVDDYKDFLTHKIKLRDWKSVHISPPKASRKTDKASTGRQKSVKASTGRRKPVKAFTDRRKPGKASPDRQKSVEDSPDGKKNRKKRGFFSGRRLRRHITSTTPFV